MLLRASERVQRSEEKFNAFWTFLSVHLCKNCTAGYAFLRTCLQSLQSWLCSWRREKSPHGYARKSRSLDKSPHGWSRARSLEASGCEDLLDSIMFADFEPSRMRASIVYGFAGFSRMR